MNEPERIRALAEELKAQGYGAICFWLCAMNVGGGTQYFARLIKEILRFTDLKIYYMDYKDGYAHDLLRGDGRVHFINYDPKAADFPIAEPTVIFTSSTKAIQIQNMRPDNKLLFWHFETVPCAWEIVFLDQETRRFMRLTRDKNAMTFHDWSAFNILNSQCRAGFRNKNYLPTFVDPKTGVAPETLIEQDTVTVGWLGRLTLDKIHSLYNLIDNLLSYETPRKKRLVIIGDGTYRKAVEKYCEKCAGQVEVVFTGTIGRDDLDDFLTNNIDVLFAMGTSVLEGAALKMPSVVVQLSTEPFVDDEFYWLYDTKEYCVGIMHEQKKDFAVKYTRFADILDAVCEQGRKGELGRRCYEYYIRNQSDITAITGDFLGFCVNTGMTFQDLKECLRFVPYQKIKVKQWQSHRIPIWTVITYGNTKYYRLFNFTLMAVRWIGADKAFLPFGIRPVLHRYTRSGYQFPNSNFKDAVRDNAELPVLDMKNALMHRKRAHVQNVRERLARGEKIRVCLFVSRISCWSLERLYRLLEADPRFEPTVVVKPFMFQGKEAMIDYMDTTYDALVKKGLRIIKGYDKKTDTFLDLRGTLDPDVVFYTKYWLPQFHENFYITSFLDRFTFYTSYCFDIADHPECMDFPLNNAVDRYFMPSGIHKRMAEGIMKNGAKNVHVTGAPKLDDLMDPGYEPKDVWKVQDKPKKRIIWAPHHSDAFPDDLYQFNAFFELSQFMLELADKYKDSVQFAFKPHPMLKPKLDKKWGKEEADRYYGQWAELENGQLETGEFIDLFRTSDAMILDSISFIAEYTSVNKPALFTIGKTTRVKLNDFGMINFDVLYKTDNDLYKDIIRFVEDVVIGGNDVKSEERTRFIQEHLQAPNGKTASENIYQNICEEVIGSADTRPMTDER